MPLIEVFNAVKIYQMGEEKFYALNDVSFSVVKKNLKIQVNKVIILLPYYLKMKIGSIVIVKKIVQKLI